MIPPLSRTAVVALGAVLLLAGCAPTPGGVPTPSRLSSPSTPPSTSTSLQADPTVSPSPRGGVSSQRKAYDACAHYAAAHAGGTLDAFSETVQVITTNQGSPALDLSITTPEGAKVLYLCVIPGYPSNFTVSTGGAHDLG